MGLNRFFGVGAFVRSRTAMSATEGLPGNLRGVGHTGKRRVGEGMTRCVDEDVLRSAQQRSVQEDVVVAGGGGCGTAEAEQWRRQSNAVQTPQM